MNTRAKVAKSNEDSEEAFMCVKVERPRPSGNSKKCSTKGSTSKVGEVYSAVCHAQSNVGHIYIGAGNELMASEVCAMRYEILDVQVSLWIWH